MAAVQAAVARNLFRTSLPLSDTVDSWMCLFHSLHTSWVPSMLAKVDCGSTEALCGVRGGGFS